MAIKEFIPKNIPVVDRRRPEGGYYVAECDECHREFYPRNRNAKYCSADCTTRAYRKRHPSVTKKTKITVKNKAEVKNDLLPKEFNGKKKLADFLKSNYNINKKDTYSFVEGMEYEESQNMGKHKICITRMSELKYYLSKMDV